MWGMKYHWSLASGPLLACRAVLCGTAGHAVGERRSPVESQGLAQSPPRNLELELNGLCAIIEAGSSLLILSKTGQGAQMPQLPIDKAARRLGISLRALQRILKTGALSAKKVDGHWLIDIPGSDQATPVGNTDIAPRKTPSTAPDALDRPKARPAGPQEPDMALGIRLLQMEVRRLRGALDATTAERDRLIGQLERVTTQLDRAQEDGRELRILLANTQRQLQALLPTPHEDTDVVYHQGT